MFSQRQDHGEGKISVIPIQINNTVSEFAKLVSYRKTEKGDNTYIWKIISIIKLSQYSVVNMEWNYEDTES